MKRTVLLLVLLMLLTGTSCSVRIYDLQPIIVGTNTPTPTQITAFEYTGVTPSPRASEATATPPLHIAPTPISVSMAVNILEITMIDGGIGWAIGQIPNNVDKLALRTTDGGETWKNVTPPQATYNNSDGSAAVSSCFRDAEHAWLIYTNNSSLRDGIQVWATADGGLSWTANPLPLSGYTVQYFKDPAISFLDTQTGWIFARIGENESREFIGLYTTHDGGTTWTSMVTSGTGNLTSQGKKNGAVFRDTLEGWITAQNTYEEPGTVLWHTFDGGNSWYKQQLPAPYGYGIPDGLLSDPSISCSLSVPTFVDTLYTCAWAVLQCSGGNLSQPVSVLYWSYDRLNSWKSLILPAAWGDLSFYGIEYGWYAIMNPVGSDFMFSIQFTEDGGENWRTAAGLAWDSTLQFITPAIGYGIATYMGMPALVRTSNSGFNWEQLSPMIVP